MYFVGAFGEFLEDWAHTTFPSTFLYGRDSYVCSRWIWKQPLSIEWETLGPVRSLFPSLEILTFPPGDNKLLMSLRWFQKASHSLPRTVLRQGTVWLSAGTLSLCPLPTPLSFCSTLWLLGIADCLGNPRDWKWHHSYHHVGSIRTSWAVGRAEDRKHGGRLARMPGHLGGEDGCGDGRAHLQ